MNEAIEVLAQYPAPLRGRIVPVGGGFSGARIFRVEAAGGMACLRAWPAGIDPPRLDFIGRLLGLASDAGLDFVPNILRTSNGNAFVRRRDRLWEMTTWMPGDASFCQAPTAERIRAACTAVARLHAAWSVPRPIVEICPAVRRRLDAAADWLPLMRTGWQPSTDVVDPVTPWAERAWGLVRARLPELPRLLEPWLHQFMPLQPCLCDIWHDHVLFTGDRVTGLIDYGSCKWDHVSVDLARLLGSMAGDDANLRAAGLMAYEEIHPLTSEERALIDDLDATGTVVAAANWLRWLYRDMREFDDRNAVARRLAGLVGRLTRAGSG